MATTSCQRSPRRPRRQPNQHLIGLRVNDGLSREQLALRAGVSRETIRLAEDGFLPSVGVQFALAHVFDLRPLDIWPLDRQLRGR